MSGSNQNNNNNFNRNNTNFPYELFNWLKTVKIESEFDFLTYYQNLVLCYFTKANLESRGLLIYHTMGMGKTLPAVAISMALVDYDPIILSSVSLHANFQKEIKMYIELRTARDPEFKLGLMPEDDLNNWIKSRYRFVTLKATNMLSQLSKAMTEDEQTKAIDKIYDEKIGELLSIGSLDGKLLIVDEAHNLFRAIINGSKNSIRLYELIMKSKNAKILFLTGTPIAKEPFELVPCFNMLGGFYDASSEASSKEKLVLPEKYTDFYRYFVDESNHVIKNKGKFQNRILGLVSYITHTSEVGKRIGLSETATKKIEFPEEKPLIIRYVNMDDKQFTAYLLAREKERAEANRSSKFSKESLHVDPLSVPGKGLSTTFRIRSRQISNYYQVGVDTNMPIDEIPADKLSSVKFITMLADINKHEGICMVFSQLLNMSGLSVFARYLETQGWTKYNTEKSTKLNYAFISGNMAIEDREKIKNILNSKENQNGELIKVILISEAGAEGLDLKNVRVVLFMEPQWTESKFDQIKHRAIRGGSHVMLPIEKRNVTVLLYLAVKPKNLMNNESNISNDKNISKDKNITNDKNIKNDKNISKDKNNKVSFETPLEKEETTDVVIYKNSKRSEQLNHSILEAVQEASIECYINGGENCRMCNVTNMTLFDWNITRDMTKDDPCKSFKKVEKQLRSIDINGIQYYWEPDTKSPFRFTIYYYSDELSSYKKMTEDDIRFIPIVEALENIKIKK
jgi:superfamily II DNA or RNA helicase